MCLNVCLHACVCVPLSLHRKRHQVRVTASVHERLYVHGSIDTRRLLRCVRCQHTSPDTTCIRIAVAWRHYSVEENLLECSTVLDNPLTYRINLYTLYSRCPTTDIYTCIHLYSYMASIYRERNSVVLTVKANRTAGHFRYIICSTERISNSPAMYTHASPHTHESHSI